MGSSDTTPRSEGEEEKGTYRYREAPIVVPEPSRESPEARHLPTTVQNASAVGGLGALGCVVATLASQWVVAGALAIIAVTVPMVVARRVLRLRAEIVANPKLTGLHHVEQADALLERIGERSVLTLAVLLVALAIALL